jgi:hypothetical protein
MLGASLTLARHFHFLRHQATKVEFISVGFEWAQLL